MNKNSFLLKELNFLLNEFKLQIPSKSYFDSETDNEAVAFCNARNALLEQAKNGTLYVKFISGNRKGSIARVHVDGNERPHDVLQAEIVKSNWSKNKTQYQIQNPYFYGTAKWDGRKNSCKLDMPGRDFVFLPNYQGPTVYEMFDKK